MNKFSHLLLKLMSKEKKQILFTGQTTGNISVPKRHNPYKEFDTQTLPPQKKKQKKTKAETIQGHAPWLNLKKKIQINFPQYTHEQGNPKVQIHEPCSQHRYPCTQIAWGVPK